MTVPGTVIQLALLLTLVMPGIVYAAVRHQIRGPMPEDRDVAVRVLRAMMVSAAFAFVYATVVGERLSKLVTPPTPAKPGQPTGRLGTLLSHPRAAGLWGLLLVFVVPTVLAVALHGFERNGWNDWRWRRGNSPVPSAWDWASFRRAGCYVRIRLKDGRYVGGWLGREAFASMHPEPHDVFIDVQCELDAAGNFLRPLPWAHGMFVNAAEADVVEWLRKPDPAAPPKP